MSFLNQIVAGLKLVRAAIQSPNYVTGVSGWTINRDGSAEFNNVVIRGGTQTQGAILMYSGTPAAGKLIASVAPAAGTDSFGNAYVQGFAVYGDPLGNAITTKLNGGELSVTSTASAYSMTLDDTGMGMTDGTFVNRYNIDQIKYLRATDDPVINDPGGIRFQMGDSIQRVVTIASGDDTAHNAAWIWLLGEDSTGSTPLVRINNAGSGPCDLTVSGNSGSANYPSTGWTAFTPTWTTSTGNNLPSYGNATLNCDWIRAGRSITARYEIVFGTTTNFGAAPGTGDNWRFSLPVTASATHQVNGWFELNQSTGARCIARSRFTTTGVTELEISSGRPDGTAITNTGVADSLSPWTWASGNSVRGQITYEAAT